MKSQSLKNKTPERSLSKGKIQPKLKVSSPGDTYEREADAMAERVMRKAESGIIARSLQEEKKSEKTNKDNPSVRRKVSTDGGTSVAPPMISQLSGNANAGGAPLSHDTRSFMENAFSRDFSHVRIHTGEQAVGMSRDIHAKAFTYGDNIYFNQGQFSPETPEGKSLLAHELTHVVQQDEDTASPDIARAVELRPPGKGEASAFDRVQELIDRLNQQSAAIQYRLDGNKLRYDVKDESALSIFDLQFRSYLDMDAMVPFRLITGKGRVPQGPDRLGRLIFDQFITGYVDLEDLLSTDRLAFQSIMIHILAERLGSPNYSKRIGGNTFTGREVKATHEVGHQAQAFHFQGVFRDPSLQFIYAEAKPGNKSHMVFRSSEKKYEVFLVVSKLNEDISHAEVKVRDANHQWYTADDFLAKNITSAPMTDPKVQPQQATGRQGGSDELKAAEKARQVLQAPQNVQGSVMRKVNSNSSITPTYEWVEQLRAVGTGAPLPEGSRKFMEDSFRTDFSKVRIHSGEIAAGLSEGIHARAFTLNGEIYFNRSEFSPETTEGKQLLAHELTHVLQQRGEHVKASNGESHLTPSAPTTIHCNRRKAGEKTKDDQAPPELTFENRKGSTIDLSGKKKIMHLKTVKYVTEKYNKLEEKFRSKLTLNKVERLDNQRTLWREEKNRRGIESGLKKRIEERAIKEEAKVVEDGKTFYFFKLKGEHRGFLIGSPEEIVDSIITPRWNTKGQSRFYHVDHILEWQVGGKHDRTNFWLWQDTANMAGGKNLSNTIKSSIRQLIEEAVTAGTLWDSAKDKPKAKFIQDRYEEFISKTSDAIVAIDTLVKGLKVEGHPEEHYDIEETFKEAKALDSLKGMSESEINSLKGNTRQLSIMIGDIVKGSPLKIENDFTGSKSTWIKGFTITAVLEYNADAKPGERYAVLSGELFRELKKKKLFRQNILQIDVFRIGGLKYFGKIKNGFRDHIVETLEFPPSSPIELVDAYFDASGKAVIEGKVKPSISLLKNLEFDITYTGNDLKVSKTFASDDLQGKLPRPFDITNAEITLSASLNEGFGVDGKDNFEIQKIGKGFIKGEKSEASCLPGVLN